MDGERPRRLGRPDWSIAIGIGLLSLAVYANSLTNGFAFDDGPILQRNHQIHSLANLSRFFEQDYFEPSTRMGLYRPLVMSSYAITVAVAGAGPFPFHLTNLLLHAANAVLLFALLLRLTGNRPLAAGSGCLFAAHAIHTEAVDSITLGRPEVMAGFFGLIALHAWLGARPGGSARPGLARAVSFAAFGFAILSKESAVSLIAVVILMDWLYPAGAGPPRRLINALREATTGIAGFSVVAAACVGLRLTALGDQAIPPVPFVDNPLGSLPDGWRLVNALLVMLRYGGLLLFPLRLSSDYSFDTIRLVRSADDPALWLGALLLVALAGLGAWSHRRDRGVFFGLGFLAVTFVPASNLLLPIGTILGERLAYLPSAGFCIAAVALLLRLVARLPVSPTRRAATVALILGVITGLHAVRAVARNPVWADDDTLRLHDVAVHPQSVKLQSNAGASLVDRGEPARALAHFEAALRPEITPDRFIKPYQGKVVALVDLGRFEEARLVYDVVILHGPRNPEIEQRIASGLRGK